MTRLEKIKLIADTYGYGPQSRQLIEEMAECTVAINKLWRNRKNKKQKKKWRKRLISELADVLIMANQMLHLLGCGKEIEKDIDFKLNRQLNRINKDCEAPAETVKTDHRKCERHITNGGSCKDRLPKYCSLFKEIEKEECVDGQNVEESADGF